MLRDFQIQFYPDNGDNGRGLRKKSRRLVECAESVEEVGTWQEELSSDAIVTFSDSTKFHWPSTYRTFHGAGKKLSISGMLIDPFVIVVDELPEAPIRGEEDCVEIGRFESTELQKNQVRELFEHFLNSGLTEREALAQLGPLAGQIRKYRYSFVVSEFRWPVKGLVDQFHDSAFMAPVRR